jgi:NAD(P)-dependent dehydrogenase (short-subunit alcohol dehydrogenase family)
VAEERDVRAYVAQTLERFGMIDCLFNNAGIEGPCQPTWKYETSAFERVMTVNVTSIFLGLRHVLPVMIAQRYGRIVNASSVAGLAASPGMIGYVASKHAVLGLTKTAAVEAGPYGVRVNAICPGAVDTAMMDRVRQAWTAAQVPIGDSFALLTPTRRSNTPEDVADIVLYLCSDAIGNINGIHLTTDGGRLSGLAPWVDEPAG